MKQQIDWLIKKVNLLLDSLCIDCECGEGRNLIISYKNEEGASIGPEYEIEFPLNQSVGSNKSHHLHIIGSALSKNIPQSTLIDIRYLVSFDTSGIISSVNIIQDNNYTIHYTINNGKLKFRLLDSEGVNFKIYSQEAGVNSDILQPGDITINKTYNTF